MININGVKLKYNDKTCEECGKQGVIGGFTTKEIVKYDEDGNADEIERQNLHEVLCKCGSVLTKVAN